MNFIKKIIFLINKPSVVLIAGNRRLFTGDIIFRILKTKFTVRKIFNSDFPLCQNKKEILILTPKLSDAKNLESFKFLIKKSNQPILVLAYLNETFPDEEKQEEVKKICELAKYFPARGFIIDNFDSSIIQQIKNEISARLLTYGFQEGADFRATDINKSEQETNFKINYEGDIVPFWLKNIFEEKEIYSVLATICVGTIKGINLVEISQALKSYNLSSI